MMPSTLSPSKRKTAGGPDVTSVATFRNLYTRILLSLQAQQHQVLGVTSAIDGEGKTTMAAGLTAALAEDRALLGFGRDADTALFIGCNTGQPPVDARLAVRPGPGLIQLLRGECELDEAIQQTAVERLAILPLGEPAHSFPLMIRTAALSDVIVELRSRFGLVVLDLPAVLNSTDTQVLARLADQLVLVVRAGVTPAKLVRQALDQIGEERFLGVVLNDAHSDLPAWLEHRI
ncbi:MAG TPA: CpsD/CapB family tyrosine-protein kinase [Chloroflexia bacterium]|nr:CpsD/CapB family tyrosine-protein kinase [Chloroflexia bacterium]